jgi:hypothetical protein
MTACLITSRTPSEIKESGKSAQEQEETTNFYTTQNKKCPPAPKTNNLS